MSISKELDLAIKIAETESTVGGYSVGERTYETYMTNAKWKIFKESMLAHALAEYGEGGGDELTEKNGRPPKMASYGSSSRMIYTLSCHNKEFHYEKKLPTTIGGIANLDGFLEKDNRYVFVEAKCHEPYSTKSNSVSKSYEKLYNYINEQMSDNLKILMTTSKCGRYMNVEYFANKEKLESFDLKQMICHLLGIATGIIKGTLHKKQIDFIYLLYDPNELDLSKDSKAEINSIYERTCYECNLVDFTTLFGVILTFLNSEKYNNEISQDDIDKIVCKFTFALVSQEYYSVLLH